MPLSELYASSLMESRVMHLSPGCPLRCCDTLRARKHLLNFSQFMLEFFDESFSLTHSLQQHLPWGPAHRRQVTKTRYSKSESLACRLDAVWWCSCDMGTCRGSGRGGTPCKNLGACLYFSQGPHPASCDRLPIHLSIHQSSHWISWSARHHARFGGRRGEQGTIPALKELAV